jgi:DNA-binding LacI/PurR family transcriptional regulator
MQRSPFANVTDQVVALLRDGILAGRWRDTLPGRDQLSTELGVSHTTMEAAMRCLAQEGMLVSQGAGKRRRIILPEGGLMPRHFRVRILAYESVDRSAPHVIDLLERLTREGFSAKIAAKSLLDLGMNVQRVARFVRQVPADAWIVAAGSREVVEWFCNQPLPAYAYFGAKSGLPIAGCGVNKDIQPLIRHLVQLGHKRIVLLDRQDHADSKPSLLGQIFLDSLQSEGILPGSYHLPVWGYHPEGLHRCLESHFRTTPPTALISEEASILIAARDHLARRGIIAPRDVSLVCLDYDPSFDWCDPLVDHCIWDYDSIVRRVVRWAKNVARGKDDRRQTDSSARFVKGGTIGPAPKT